MHCTNNVKCLNHEVFKNPFMGFYLVYGIIKLEEKMCKACKNELNEQFFRIRDSETDVIIKSLPSIKPMVRFKMKFVTYLYRMSEKLKEGLK